MQYNGKHCSNKENLVQVSALSVRERCFYLLQSSRCMIIKEVYKLFLLLESDFDNIRSILHFLFSSILNYIETLILLFSTLLVLFNYTMNI